MLWSKLLKFFGLTVLVGATVTSVSAQNSYVEAKGALQWLTKLSETIDLNRGSIVDAYSNQSLASGGTLFKVTDLPVWHGTGAYGWNVNDMLSLETELSFGQRTFNTIDFTAKVPSNSNAVSIVHWYDINKDNNVTTGELATSTPDQSSDYISAMVNTIYNIELSDEFDLGLGIGGGLVYAHYTSGIDGSSAVLPGYQLKTKLRFQANAGTYYLLEGGFQASFADDLADTISNTRNVGDGLGDYMMSYSHFWTSIGVGYKF